MDFLLISIGIVLLFLGGEVFVRGSTAISLQYGVPKLIVGMTVIAFGTSAPELMVSLQSALTGHGDIVFGNVIGSNIANILLILGIPAAFSTIPCDGHGTMRGWVQMIAATVLMMVLVMFQPFGLWQGLVLLAFLAFILFVQIRDAIGGKIEVDVEVDDALAAEPMSRIILFIVLGIIFLPLGANFMVTGAVNIAKDFGISEAVIGLTIVAIGTSLPELAASITAVFKGENALALGNVLGSNLFNIALILGITATVTEVSISPQIITYDMPFLLAVSIGLGIFVWRRMCISRLAGFAMVSIYLAYLVSLLWMS